MQPTTQANQNNRQVSPVESLWSRRARRFFRWYRNGPFPVAHPLLRRLLRAATPRDQVITLRSGLRMQVDLDKVIQNTIFWYDGDMEPQLSWAVRELLPLGGTLIDCGANCGYIGLEARLQRNARVLFIEPHPGLAASIQQNIDINEWGDSCTLIQAAASDHEGTASLFVCDAYDGSHSLLSDWWPHQGETQRVEVQLETLAHLLEGNSHFSTVSFLKVDTEGNDFAVLKGLGAQLTPARVNVIYAELDRDREVAWRLLSERGYAGFGYRPRASAKALRRDVRRHGDGAAIAFYLPLDHCPGAGETLWVPKGSVQENYLLSLAERATVVQSN